MSICRSSESCCSQNNLRCDLCGNIFPYSPDSIGKLGKHSCDAHWFHKIGHFVGKRTECRGPKRIQWISKAKVNVRRLTHGDFLELYKTTIESWHDGPTELRCCACGYLGSPYIRKQKNKVSSTRFGQYLLMACWPLFFAPMTSRNEISLYCKKCGALFGCYDERNGSLIQSCCSSHVNCEVSSCSKF